MSWVPLLPFSIEADREHVDTHSRRDRGSFFEENLPSIA